MNRTIQTVKVNMILQSVYVQYTTRMPKINQTPDPFFIFIFLFFFFFFFFFFFLKGHNTCIAYRIFVYLSPLARKKERGFCSAIGNLKLD